MFFSIGGGAGKSLEQNRRAVETSKDVFGFSNTKWL